jgi:hypothetical protein
MKRQCVFCRATLAQLRRVPRLEGIAEMQQRASDQLEHPLVGCPRFPILCFLNVFIAWRWARKHSQGPIPAPIHPKSA